VKGEKKRTAPARKRDLDGGRVRSQIHQNRLKGGRGESTREEGRGIQCRIKRGGPECLNRGIDVLNGLLRFVRPRQGTVLRGGETTIERIAEGGSTQRRERGIQGGECGTAPKK